MTPRATDALNVTFSHLTGKQHVQQFRAGLACRYPETLATSQLDSYPGFWNNGLYQEQKLHIPASQLPDTIPTCLLTGIKLGMSHEPGLNNGNHSHQTLNLPRWQLEEYEYVYNFGKGVIF